MACKKRPFWTHSLLEGLFSLLILLIERFTDCSETITELILLKDRYICLTQFLEKLCFRLNGECKLQSSYHCEGFKSSVLVLTRALINSI